MPPQLPILKAREVVQALLRVGFFIHHTTGSHVQLRHRTLLHLRITVPNHPGDLPKRDLHSILKQASLSREEFLKLL
jgi:predicted RNA binding protein YcfA (HicA-like mRNA interferase family)